MKNDQEHLFRNIQRNEYHNLFDFISGKGLKIMNLGGTETVNGVAASVLENVDVDAIDPHFERIRNEVGGADIDKENIKKTNPGLSFIDVGRGLGEKWNKMSAEEKEPYESMAQADKKRYAEAFTGYKSGTSAI